MKYLVVGPVIDPGFIEKFSFPIGQQDLFFEILGESKTVDEFLECLRMEYLAVVRALKKLGIDHSIAHTGGIIQEADMPLLNELLEIGSSFEEIPPPRFAPFPRDITATIGDNILLLNPKFHRDDVYEEINGWKVISSPYGEGGRVLNQGQTMIVSERVSESHNITTRSDISLLQSIGLKVGTMPLPVSLSYLVDGTAYQFCNDHLDRVACLLRGSKDNKLHMIVDPLVQTAAWKDDSDSSSWDIRPPDESLREIKLLCDELDITLHVPDKLNVTYSLNMEQFPDGRVLMTSGDSDVEEIVVSIVGKENLYKTDIPIQYYPTLLFAGIRCMINQWPDID